MIDPRRRGQSTVDVLGSYLFNFCDGDIRQAPSFAIDAVATSDLKAAKLRRVLQFYSEKLSTKERDLLARLSVFPHGVRLELLIALTRSKDRIAGSLSKSSDVEVKSLLMRLKSLGLIFRFGTTADECFTAHPFIRGFFQATLGVDQEKGIHGAVATGALVLVEASPYDRIWGIGLKADDDFPRPPCYAALPGTSEAKRRANDSCVTVVASRNPPFLGHRNFCSS